MIEDSELKCQYCNKIFTRRSSLHNHVNKRTKGCLKIEEELKCKPEQDKVPCVFCKKVFSNKYTLEVHMRNRPTHCLNKELEDVNKELDDEKSVHQKLKNENQFLKFKLETMEWKVQNLETDLEKARDKVMVINNNIITNNTTNNNNRILNLTPMNLEADDFTERIKDLFSEKYMLSGQEGIARFVAENLLTDEDGNLKYICTDPSRQIFKFMTDKGVGKDIKASKLTSAIYDEIKSKTADTTNQLFDKSKTEDGETNTEVHDVVLKALTEITGMGNDNSQFSRELAKLTT